MKIIIFSVLFVMGIMANEAADVHKIARQDVYPGYPKRFQVDDDKVDWAIEYKDYTPAFYVDTRYSGRYGKENSNDWFSSEKIYKSSFQTMVPNTKINLDPKGRPLNPLGRTGLRGPGALQKWGEILTAELLLIRIQPNLGKKQILLVQDADKHFWAVPGQKVTYNESPQQVILRDILAKLSFKLPSPDVQLTEVYRGYVDDPRNTDNSWISSVIYRLDIGHVSTNLDTLESRLPDSFSWVDVDQLNAKQFATNHKEIILAALSNDS